MVEVGAYRSALKGQFTVISGRRCQTVAVLRESVPRQYLLHQIPALPDLASTDRGTSVC
jgi:hypothetical protein